jgi:CheY-like chemotaxis protein
MDWSDKKLLIVEDEEVNFYLLEEYLEPTCINISKAYNGLEALEHLANNNFDLVLMDIKMPKLNGYETIKRLKDLNIIVPVIAQTAYTMVGDKEKFLKAGFDEYISKPINEDELLGIMKKFLG